MREKYKEVEVTRSSNVFCKECFGTADIYMTGSQSNAVIGHNVMTIKR